MDPGSIQAETSMGAYVNAASSQPPAYEEQDEDSDSSEDYAELGQLCGSDYYDQVVRLLSYKSKYNNIKAQHVQMSQLGKLKIHQHGSRGRLHKSNLLSESFALTR